MTGVTDELVGPNASESRFDLLLDEEVPEGLERVVFNIAYMSPHSVWSAQILPSSPFRFTSLKEVVFHFKKVGERVRVTRGTWVPDTVYAGYQPPPRFQRTEDFTVQALRFFQETLPSAPLEPSFHDVWFFHSSFHRHRQCLFEQIAHLFADAVKAGGSVPKLTMVGLKDLGLHRDAAAADDAVIDDFVNASAADGRFVVNKQYPFPRGLYAHPPCQPLRPPSSIPSSSAPTSRSTSSFTATSSSFRPPSTSPVLRTLRTRSGGPAPRISPRCGHRAEVRLGLHVSTPR